MTEFLVTRSLCQNSPFMLPIIRLICLDTEVSVETPVIISACSVDIPLDAEILLETPVACSSSCPVKIYISIKKRARSPRFIGVVMSLILLAMP